MKKSMLQVSLLVGLSTLFVACGSGHHSPSQHPTPSIPNTQPDSNVNRSSSDKHTTDSSVNENQNPDMHTERSPLPSMPNGSRPESSPNSSVPSAPNSTQAGNKQADQSQMDMPSPIKDKLSNDTLSATWYGITCNFLNNCTPHENKPNSVITNKSSSHFEAISLQLGENSDDQQNYKFTLLGNGDTGIIYYGHRNNPKDGKHLSEIVYGMREDFTNKTIPSNFNATYEKEKGFIYLLTSLSNQNESFQAQYADISLTYKNGEASGTVTSTIKENNNKTTLFNITKGAESNTLTVTPTDQNPTFDTKDQATFYLHVVDSGKNKNDHKYLVGSGGGLSWNGVFTAERKDSETITPATSRP